MRRIDSNATSSRARCVGPKWDVTVDGPTACGHYQLPSVPNWSTQRQNEVLIKSEAQISDAVAEVGLFLAEVEKTLKMLRNPLQALKKALVALGKAKDAVRQLRVYGNAAADHWLLYRYGIMPLISDITSMIELANKAITREGMVSTRARTKTVDKTKVGITSAFGGIDHQLTCTTEIVEKYQASHTFLITLENSFGTFGSNAMRAGMSPSQILALAWELVAYSFVIDWALSVGDWLKAVSPVAGVSHLGNYVSRKTEIYQKVTSTPLGRAYYGPLVQSSPGEFRVSIEQLERRVFLTTPVLPALNSKILSVKRIADTLALLQGTWGDGRQPFKSKR